MEVSHGTIFHFLYYYGILPKWLPETVPISWLIIIGLGVFGYFASRNLQRIPTGWQLLAEMYIEAMRHFVTGIVGPHGKKFVPYIGSLFIYILLNNMMIQVPGFNAPTADANTTIAFAVVTFFVIQGAGISANGIVGYVKHFAGSPKDLLGWVMVPLMLPLELIGELAKPLSLSMRLFGNIFGEDMVILILMALAVHALHMIPVQIPMMLFGVFGGTVQALVFVMLTCVYLVILTAHDEH